jgi:KipI family sensor histidine kinase inhibitor
VRSPDARTAEAPIARRVLPYGERALLVELADSAQVVAFTDAVRDALPPGVIELVPAARTVLVRYDPVVCTGSRLHAELAALDLRPLPTSSPRRTGRTVTIDVRYDGEDLELVAAQTGLAVDEVIALHQAAEYRSAFCGFAPGFAYLTGLDERLHVPRLDAPRPSVAAGSVAIAGPYAGVYPNRMPGGWRILGHTDAVLWDLGRDLPALLEPGTRVRFRSGGR